MSDNYNINNNITVTKKPAFMIVDFKELKDKEMPIDVHYCNCSLKELKRIDEFLNKYIVVQDNDNICKNVINVGGLNDKCSSDNDTVVSKKDHWMRKELTIDLEKKLTEKEIKKTEYKMSDKNAFNAYLQSKENVHHINLAIEKETNANTIAMYQETLATYKETVNTIKKTMVAGGCKDRCVHEMLEMAVAEIEKKITELEMNLKTLKKYKKDIEIQIKKIVNKD